jgi:FAD dependent oxidoreductase TIGR03364
LLIERNGFPSDASTRNFGILAQSLAAQGTEEAGLIRASRDIYLDLQRQHDISVRVKGSLYLASTELENTVLQEFASGASPDLQCSYLGAREALRRYPFIQKTYCAGALLFPGDLTLEPRHMLRQLIPYIVERHDVEYIPHTTAVMVEAKGRQCTVKDARGDAYIANQVIVCSGADYRTLFPDLFRAKGIQLCKLQMMQTVPMPDFELPHSILSGLSIRRYPAFISCPSYAMLASQPIDEDLRSHGIHLLIKQAADGSVIIGDSHEYRDCAAAASLEEITNPAINVAILRYAAQMIRLPAWDIQTMWNGYYLVPKGQEIYSEVIDDSIHLVIAGGKGMTMGPGFARQHIDALIRG